MIVHLVDGRVKGFASRGFVGLSWHDGSASDRRDLRTLPSLLRIATLYKGKDRPYGAVVGVLQGVLQLIDHVKDSASRGPSGAYIGVATDHVIESFRNRLWADYKRTNKDSTFKRPKERAGRPAQ